MLAPLGRYPSGSHVIDSCGRRRYKWLAVRTVSGVDGIIEISDRRRRPGLASSGEEFIEMFMSDGLKPCRSQRRTHSGVP